MKKWLILLFLIPFVFTGCLGKAAKEETEQAK